MVSPGFALKFTLSLEMAYDDQRERSAREMRFVPMPMLNFQATRWQMITLHVKNGKTAPESKTQFLFSS
jgi:hypothetical protein